jgi:hypothetical protein
MTKLEALNWIRSQLNNRPLLYQLGFLQGFLAKQMIEKPELRAEFKQQVKNSQRPD